MATSSLREDVLALLEGGPEPITQLSVWLQMPIVPLLRHLRAFAAAGDVRCLNPSMSDVRSQWALAPGAPSEPAGGLNTRLTTADAAAPKTEPAPTGPVALPAVSRRAVPPRCSRCFQPFRPTSADDYQCAACHDRPLQPRPAEPELVPHWKPHRDAPSLTDGAGGLGSTLAGSDFRVLR